MNRRLPSRGAGHGGPAKGAGEGGPARGRDAESGEWRDRRPPFEAGNEVSVRHGAYSPRRVDPLAREILEAVQSDVTWWRAADLPIAWKWAQAEARVQLLTEYLMDGGGQAGGLLDGDGEVRSAARFLVKCASIAANLASRLGLDPLSRARLGRDVAQQQVDLAKLWAVQGRDDGSGAAGAPGARSGAFTAADDAEHPSDGSGSHSGSGDDEDVVPW